MIQHGEFHFSFLKKNVDYSQNDFHARLMKTAIRSMAPGCLYEYPQRDFHAKMFTTFSCQIWGMGRIYGSLSIPATRSLPPSR